MKDPRGPFRTDDEQSDPNAPSIAEVSAVSSAIDDALRAIDEAISGGLERKHRARIEAVLDHEVWKAIDEQRMEHA